MTRRPRKRLRVLLRPELLALAAIAIGLAVVSARGAPPTAQLELLSSHGSLSLSNSREGSAILSLAPMRPGDTVSGTVTIGNTGTVAGDLVLSSSNLVDVPGANGGALSARLDLLVRDVTDPLNPATVYSGPIPGLSPMSLGSLAPAATRDYEFRIDFPSGAGDNAYQGSSLSVQFDWTATAPDGGDTDPPETAITAAPNTRSATPGATFSFVADEAGSTFECSLDGGAFAPCSSPAAYEGLADGAHSFSVRARDAAGNVDATPAARSWTVDTTAPAAPGSFRGVRQSGRLILSWSAAADGAGSIDGYLVYANGSVARTLDGSVLSVDLGLVSATDARRFQVAARDAAGNTGPKTYAIVLVPALKNVPLAKAKSRLAARGLKVGTIARARSSTTPAGRVIKTSRTGVVRTGTPVGLTVSLGSGGTSSGSSGGGTTGSRGSASGTGGTTSGNGTTSPSSSPAPAAMPTTTSVPEAAPTASNDAGTEAPPAAAVTPASGEDDSGLRRALGLALAGGALIAAAGGGLWHLRRGRLWTRPSSADVEPILFWDERLARAAVAAVRRVAGIG
jgi:hypothetical protein